MKHFHQCRRCAVVYAHNGNKCYVFVRLCDDCLRVVYGYVDRSDEESTYTQTTKT